MHSGEASMKTRYTLIYRAMFSTMLVTAAMLSIACKNAADGPPEIVIDKSACTRCSMLISDGRFAAAIKVNSVYLVFDDIGCMLAYAGEHKTPVITEWWVRDYIQDRWIGAEHAAFFHANGDLTPMGYGYVAVQESITKPPVGLKDPVSLRSFTLLRTDFLNRSDNPRP